MSQQNHELREMVALYASGAMSDAETAAFEERIDAGDPALLAELSRLEPVICELGEAVEPVIPSAETRDAVLQMAKHTADRADKQVWRRWSADQSSLDLFTLRSDEGDWEETGVEGITVRRLFVDETQNRMTAMFKMAPGSSYVPHIHDTPEECYVLVGDLHVGDEIVMHAGDYQRAPAGSQHGIQRTENGCLLLITCSLNDELI